MLCSPALPCQGAEPLGHAASMLCRLCQLPRGLWGAARHAHHIPDVLVATSFYLFGFANNKMKIEHLSRRDRRHFAGICVSAYGISHYISLEPLSYDFLEVTDPYRISDSVACF